MKIYTGIGRNQYSVRDPRIGHEDSNGQARSFRMSVREALPDYDAVWAHVKDRPSYEDFIVIVEADRLGLPIVITFQTQGLIPHGWHYICDEFETRLEIPRFVQPSDLGLVGKMIIAQLREHAR